MGNLKSILYKYNFTSTLFDQRVICTIEFLFSQITDFGMLVKLVPILATLFLDHKCQVVNVYQFPTKTKYPTVIHKSFKFTIITKLLQKFKVVLGELFGYALAVVSMTLQPMGMLT